MSPQLRDLAQAMLAEGLPDVPLTHPTDWGLELDLPGFRGQRAYVWAEMVPGYMTTTAEAAGGDPRWEGAWLDREVRIVQFFGFDNAWFHLFLHPALLLAWDEEANPPAAYVTNEFYELRGEKFSTSRRHAVWAAEILEAVEPDVVRFVLAADRPEVARTNFDGPRFAALLEGELIGLWESWILDLLERLDNAPEGIEELLALVPAEDVDRVGRIVGDAVEGLEDRAYSPQRTCRSLGSLVREGRHHAAGHARTRREGIVTDASRAGLGAELLCLVELARGVAPVMPVFAAALWAALGLDGTPHRGDLLLVPEVSGTFPPERFFAPLDSSGTEILGSEVGVGH